MAVRIVAYWCTAIVVCLSTLILSGCGDNNESKTSELASCSEQFVNDYDKMVIENNELARLVDQDVKESRLISSEKLLNTACETFRQRHGTVACICQNCYAEQPDEDAILRYWDFARQCERAKQSASE
jgi:hypothetical protein